jgi:hypothetical protein
MPVLLLILFIGVMLYFYWRHKSSALSRNCRWREDRSKDRDGQRSYNCTYCGETLILPIGEVPKHCARKGG